MRKFKHLTLTDRLCVEKFCKAGMFPQDIAKLLGVHNSTIYRELRRGRYEHLNSDYTTSIAYSPDISEQRYRENLSAKGSPLKIGHDHALATHIEYRIINDNYSPAAVLGEIIDKKLQFSTTICKSTLYTYIDKGVFLNLTNKNLPRKPKRRAHYRHVRPARAPRGTSIEKRPDYINERVQFGHWEMDCVEGKKRTKKTLLVLTERVTRYEIIMLMKDQTSKSVVKALDCLERKYKELFVHLFKSITVDNGSEFADCHGMERSIYKGKKRTTLYYCHPYSSWERGSNENCNCLIRRHFPKGTDFTRVKYSRVQYVQDWVNSYPREIFRYRPADQLYNEHMQELLKECDGCVISA